jgi:hypothetical protein
VSEHEGKLIGCGLLRRRERIIYLDALNITEHNVAVTSPNSTVALRAVRLSRDAL